MAERAVDYAVPVDGRSHGVHCGPGQVLHAEYDVLDEEPDVLAPERVVFLWVREYDPAPPGPMRTRRFTVVEGGNPWPLAVVHVASVRGQTPGAVPATLHVLEVLT